MASNLTWEGLGEVAAKTAVGTIAVLGTTAIVAGICGAFSGSSNTTVRVDAQASKSRRKHSRKGGKGKKNNKKK